MVNIYFEDIQKKQDYQKTLIFYLLTNMNNKMKILLTVFCATILVLAVKGKSGNPTEATMNDLSWTTNGPFELSPERGRFALTYSLVENKSVGFSIPVA